MLVLNTCFQIVKFIKLYNYIRLKSFQENIIKSMVNEMDTNLLPGENYKQQASVIFLSL